MDSLFMAFFENVVGAWFSQVGRAITTAEIYSKLINSNVNGYSVERAIRYAIQFAYDHKPKTILSFMDDLDDVHCPTNSEFIAKATCYVNGWIQ